VHIIILNIFIVRIQFLKRNFLQIINRVKSSSLPITIKKIR